MKKAVTLWVACLLLTAANARTEEVTIRVHHFMSAKGSLHSRMLAPFAERIAKASDGRIKVELFHSMSLGGVPAGLYDQAVDGAVDVVLTVPGYTAGRFNRTEVFELPFMMDDSVATSKAFWDLIESELQDGEYSEVKVLSGWVHGPGVIHSKEPIAKLEDVKGMELRGPTRVITDYLGEIGAIPAGMPLPQIPENLSKGVISGALLPWEVTPSIRMTELVDNHTELNGDRALYTITFVLAMNRHAYEAMPADLRAILDAETGAKMAAFAGGVMAKADAAGRESAAGNNIIELSESESARWVTASRPVYERWVARAAEKGFDGDAAIAQAKKLIAAHR